VFVTVIVTALSILGMDKLLGWMHTPDDIYDMAKTYIVIICSGICWTVLYNLQASIMRAIGNSVVPLVLLIISSAANIILDYVLIVPFKMGVAGAAYATIASQGLSGVLCLIYIIKKVPALHISKRHLMLDEQYVRNQLGVGIPMALQFSITAIGTMLVQAALNLLGSTVVASYSVSVKVEQLVTQPFGAMGVTMATYSAQNRGVNDLERIKKGVKAANVMSAIYAVIIYGVLQLILPYAVRLFVTENIELIIGYARTYVNICGLFFIPLGMIFIFRNTLQGCGFGVIPMMGGVVELASRSVAAFIAAKLLSYAGVCFANAGAWLTAGVFFWIVYRRLYRKMVADKKAHEERKATGGN
jgi:putative MATE family efflux protein